ncbi:MAG: PGPGW domain-containing protein [Xanthomonadales bacterium]|nr:PGPGW domain-containing protein [Xanthomonadales bacterium]
MERFAEYWPKRPMLVTVGTIALLLGLVFMVIPGPGLVMIAAGLSILGAEYAWARRRTRQVRDYLRRRGW